MWDYITFSDIITISTKNKWINLDKSRANLPFVHSLNWTPVDIWKCHNIFMFSNLFLLVLMTALQWSDQDIVKEPDFEKFCVPIPWNKPVVSKRYKWNWARKSFFHPATIPCCASRCMSQLSRFYLKKQSHQAGQGTHLGKRKSLLHAPWSQPSKHVFEDDFF